jgi:hypothetical protein
VMLHAFHVLVDGLFIKAEAAEQASEDLVAFDDFFRNAPTLSSQNDSAIALVDDEAVSIEALDHGGDARRSDVECCSNVCHTSVALGANEAMDLLQVVLGCGGAGREIGHGEKLADEKNVSKQQKSKLHLTLTEHC